MHTTLVNGERERERERETAGVECDAREDICNVYKKTAAEGKGKTGVLFYFEGNLKKKIERNLQTKIFASEPPRKLLRKSDD